MTNQKVPENFSMISTGESVNDYFHRTGGNLQDFEKALLNHKKELAESKGVSIEELHFEKLDSNQQSYLAQIAISDMQEEINGPQ